MDGDGFDDNTWSPQHEGLGGFDLNSQAPVADEFPGLQQYGAFIQGDGVELPPVRARGTGNLSYRPPRPGAPYARQLQFGGSSSAAATGGGGNGGGSSSGAGGPVRQRANSAGAAPVRRPQRANLASRATNTQRVPRHRAPRPNTRAVRGQATGSMAPFDNNDAAMEDDIEELASSGGPMVSHVNRAQWNDATNACLLELCIEQRRAGTFSGNQMSAEGYNAIINGLVARRGLGYNRGQVKNQIGVLRNIHSFWRYLQGHTGLGRLPDGTIDADSEWWKTHTEKKPYLKKLQFGPPANEDLLDELFRGLPVDGTTAFVPGDDYGDEEEAARSEEEEEFQPTPTSNSSHRKQKGKRPVSSTRSTLTSPVKKTKSPMVKIVRDIASTFKESVATNNKHIQKRVDEKAAFSVKRCQELAFECGVEQTVESVYAMSKLFATEYQREFFCGQLTPQLRFGYFKKWCRDNNLE
ncbi:unnamed protein product [Urochloa decumbens]|uniref:Myb/SANT-like domain-containing protein n=1 Tax=Urochloa decumbens TaxID=240449 RepID=A0ABC9AS37_9POAL